MAKKNFSCLYKKINISEGVKIPYYLALYIFLYEKHDNFTFEDCIKYSSYLFDNNQNWLGSQLRSDKKIFDLLTKVVIFKDLNIYAYHDYVFKNNTDEITKSTGIKNFIRYFYTHDLHKKNFAIATYDIYSSQSNFLKTKNFTITIILEYVISIYFSTEIISQAKKDHEFLLFLVACVILNHEFFKYTPTKNQIRELNASFYINTCNLKIKKPFFIYLVDIYKNLAPQLPSTLTAKLKMFSTSTEDFSLDALKKDWGINSV